jgi:hypothetical protein
MKDEDEVELIRGIAAIIERHGEAARGNASAEEAARLWINAGFDETEEIEEWLMARCFSAEGARSLDLAGITPDQAGMRTRAGAGDYEETIGYKIIKGDLSLEEAKRIITNAFWNS